MKKTLHKVSSVYKDSDAVFGKQAMSLEKTSTMCDLL